MNLYKVTLQGLQYAVAGPVYGVSYVIADNMDKAYELVRAFLDKEDIGFPYDRCLKSVELVAQTGKCPEVDTILFV